MGHLPTLFQVKSFIKYWLESVDRHSLHSPFFYDFYTKVIKREIDYKGFQRLENLRNQLIRDTNIISVEDFGAGSKVIQGNRRTISSIAKTSLTPQKYSALYNRVIERYQPKKILELGTSFGINTLYMALASQAEITTFEGSKEICAVARLTFTLAGAKNITLVEGDINNTLSNFLQSSRKIDVVFIDANHRYHATKNYFELILPKLHSNSLLILDDIHYSEEMEKAWHELRGHTLVYATVDLYRCGFVFFDPSLNKQHVVLQF